MCILLLMIVTKFLEHPVTGFLGQFSDKFFGWLVGFPEQAEVYDRWKLHSLFYYLFRSLFPYIPLRAYILMQAAMILTTWPSKCELFRLFVGVYAHDIDFGVFSVFPGKRCKVIGLFRLAKAVWFEKITRKLPAQRYPSPSRVESSLTIVLL